MNEDTVWLLVTAVTVLLAVLAVAAMGTAHGPQNAALLLEWGLALLLAGFLAQRGLRRAYNYIRRPTRG